MDVGIDKTRGDGKAAAVENFLVRHRRKAAALADHADCEIYVDVQTGVEYVRFRGGNAIAPLINSYGAPLIYPGFDGREDRI